MKYSINQIKKAGKKLIVTHNDEDSLNKLSFWRALHAEPLENATNLVETYGKKINKNVLIAKRLKRTESIVNKLCRLEQKIQLSTMNDIAGCRAILPNVKEVNKLVSKLSKDKTFKVFRDYIHAPRDSGYRRIHIIGFFLNSEFDKKMSVELQIRSYVQHSWATAVEIVDLFTKDSIKTNQGSKEWSQFFVKLSKIFHVIDNSFTLVSQNKKINISDKDQYFTEAFKIFLNECIENSLFKEIMDMGSLIEKLDITDKFQLFAKSVKLTTEDNKDKIFEDGYILLVIDREGSDSFNIESKTYHKDLVELANQDYLVAEKDVLLNKHYVTALISSNAIGEIKKAYPNYFADSTSFIEYIYMIIAVQKEFKKVYNLEMQQRMMKLEEIKILSKGLEKKFF